jgi:phosphoribosylformylglycinamidine cyclo-ligase
VEDCPAELGGASVGEALLRVHRSYLDPIQVLTDADLAKGLVHVTGGGLPGNLQRVVPEGRKAVVDYDAWERPALFSLIQSMGDVPEADMRRTFNLGMGLVAIVREAEVGEAVEQLEAIGEAPVRIGRVASATNDSEEAE